MEWVNHRNCVYNLHGVLVREPEETLHKELGCLVDKQYERQASRKDEPRKDGAFKLTGFCLHADKGEMEN